MTTTDPILQAHEVLPHFYVISGGFTPISIRDQMLRGSLVVERLLQNQILDSTTPLLIIGAGAGGVTAAIQAARAGVPTTLVDRGTQPFALQRRTATRHINPTQYDWPVDHWVHGVFPWMPSHMRMPLPFPSAWAGDLATSWKSEFDRQRLLLPDLHYYSSTEVASIDPDAKKPLLRATFTRSLSGPDDFAAVIWAAGAGVEECRLFKAPRASNPDPIYEGPAFWSTDRLTESNCGLSYAPRVLISGAGDGGLQDYLRVMTKSDSPAELYRICNIPQEIADALQSAEDRAHRGRAWVDNAPALRNGQEHPIFWELHQAHETAVDDALTVRDVQQSLAQLFPVAPETILLVYRNLFFTNYYGLNRFLVLLFAKYIESRHGVTTLRPETNIIDVSTANTGGHRCMTQVGGKWEPNGGRTSPMCYGLDHEVTFQHNGSSITETFNIIIVRHGPQSSTIPTPPLHSAYQNRLPLARPRHLLPYHQPQ